ncbi:MAG TPA: hypothetical protein VMA98_02970 [Candidatus Acidoferrales bacterium]|nr:hypothetical protein [Candidatus Acidoferrales bacterium]
MIRRVYAFAAIALLAMVVACGGGGKSGSPLPTVPNQPSSKKAGTATFKVKLPGKATMAKLHRNYQSPATQGISIDWSSANPYEPDFAAPVSITCPSPLPSGVTACSTDPDGGTDYTFQIPIPAGTYTLTVSSFDQAPGGSPLSFAANANMLVQGQVGGVAIVAGATNTIPNITFYGIPVSVSFVPAPGQSHVVQYGGATVASSSAPQLAIIGNAPQSFYAYPLDADGYIISNNDGSSTEPTVSVGEISADDCKVSTYNSSGAGCVSVAQPAPSASPYLFTVTATAAYGPALLQASATLPNGAAPNGTNSATTLYGILPVQEVWTSQAGGLYGYPLYPSPGPTPSPPTQLNNPIDAANPSCGCAMQFIATDSQGNVWGLAEGSGLYEFKQQAGSPNISQSPSPVISASSLPSDPSAMTIDSNGYIYITDLATSEIFIYNSSGTEQTVISFGGGSADPESVAIAPSNAPNGLSGTIWVGGYNDSVQPVIQVYSAYSGGPTAPSLIATVSTAGTPSALAFDPSGFLWMYDSSDALMDVGTPNTSSITWSSSGLVGVYGGAQIAVSDLLVAFTGGPDEEAGLGFYADNSQGTGVYSSGTTLSSFVYGVAITP